jgi:hypothetical protein
MSNYRFEIRVRQKYFWLGDRADIHFWRIYGRSLSDSDALLVSIARRFSVYILIAAITPNMDIKTNLENQTITLYAVIG